tara:strand:+ start:116 stop:298 length:183 start_codon:yes stop_codon:yes gene_type:complete
MSEVFLSLRIYVIKKLFSHLHIILIYVIIFIFLSVFLVFYFFIITRGTDCTFIFTSLFFY